MLELFIALLQDVEGRIIVTLCVSNYPSQISVKCCCGLARINERLNLPDSFVIQAETYQTERHQTCASGIIRETVATPFSHYGGFSQLTRLKIDPNHILVRNRTIS